ncbi:MAG: glycine zipper domain-containing protein [Phycisphaerae bacterium]|nr:glycine zipper domain-containing protein [Phycisphaerae bacterium]
MSRKLIIILIAAVLCLCSTFLTGCANNAQTYGAYGAVGGGLIGAATGGVGGAVVGAAIGGGAGYVIGNEEDKH